MAIRRFDIPNGTFISPKSIRLLLDPSKNDIGKAYPLSEAVSDLIASLYDIRRSSRMAFGEGRHGAFAYDNDGNLANRLGTRIDRRVRKLACDAACYYFERQEEKANWRIAFCIADNVWYSAGCVRTAPFSSNVKHGYLS